MNDRYLYKAKRFDNGEWEIGSLIILPNGDCEIGNRCSNPPDSDPMWKKCIITHKVDPSTICQCTGLKDKNGKLIWENDIVRIVYNGIEHVYKVIWDVSELDFKATNGEENYESNFQYLMCCDEIEAIGNIFDNPELIPEADRSEELLEVEE